MDNMGDIIYRISPKNSHPLYSLPILSLIVFDGEQPDATDSFILKNVSGISCINDTKLEKSFVSALIHGNSSI
jgi:hypothetical protein